MACALHRGMAHGTSDVQRFRCTAVQVRTARPSKPGRALPVAPPLCRWMPACPGPPLPALQVCQMSGPLPLPGKPFNPDENPCQDSQDVQHGPFCLPALPWHGLPGAPVHEDHRTPPACRLPARTACLPVPRCARAQKARWKRLCGPGRGQRGSALPCALATAQGPCAPFATVARLDDAPVQLHPDEPGVTRRRWNV